MEATVKKREWVKNAAIIFLSVMLVLTFFSNTFMNRTLPEVSTQQVTSGTINTKIRGSGAVTSNSTLEVTLEQSRTVETVLVKNGQEVAVGDILFTLKAGEGDELETAVTALETAELNYKIALLEAKKGGSSTTGDAADSAYSEYKAASAKRQSIGTALDKLSTAQAAVDSANASLSEAKAHLDILSGGKLSEIVKLKELLTEAEKNLATSVANDNAAGLTLDSETTIAWEKAVSDYKAELESKYSVPLTEYDVLYDKVVQYEQTAASAAANLASVKATYGDYTADDYAAAKSAEESAKKAYSTASDALSDALSNEKIDDQIDALKNSQTEKELQKLREKVAELSATTEGNQVTAKAAGVINDITVTAGSVTTPGTALATIQQNDRGYSVKISVTAEQAKKVTVGDTADVGNYYWWGSEITATLESILPDAQSAGKNKFLVFTVAGDVDVGTNLDISIGQKSASYDAIVPNSALRNDSNGDFVLAITQKSSPLGNRYVATRVDIKILAKDDTSTAISGLGSGEYVITTSSKPIEAGQLVRMAEG